MWASEGEDASLWWEGVIFLQKRKTTTSSKEQTNQIMVSVVVGVVLFGLGYVVGKTRTRLASEKYYDTKMNTIRQEMMDDRDFRDRMMQQMMGDEGQRKWLFDKVDEYRLDQRRGGVYSR